MADNNFLSTNLSTAADAKCTPAGCRNILGNTQISLTRPELVAEVDRREDGVGQAKILPHSHEKEVACDAERPAS